MSKVVPIPAGCLGLNIGCGEFPREGWLNTDLTVEPENYRKADLAADMCDLPFADESFTNVYAGHVMEHVAEDRVVVALREIRRVLARGGGLMVVIPDIDRARDKAPEMVDAIAGDAAMNRSGDPGWCHMWVPNGPKMLSLCKRVFPLAEEVSIGTVGPEWPLVSAADWQAAVICPR